MSTRPQSSRCPIPARSTSKVLGPIFRCRCAKSRRTTRRPPSVAKRIRRSMFTTAPAPIPTRPPRSISVAGLPALRAQWIAERGDVEELAGLSSEFGRIRAERQGARRTALPRPAPQAAARQGRQERLADALRPPGHHHAGDGIRRHPRKQQSSRLHRIPAVNRKNGRKNGCPALPPAPRPELRRQHPGRNHPGIRP